MTYDEYKNALNAMFLKYGFIATPLNKTQIFECFKKKISLDNAYSLGCDVYAGYGVNLYLVEIK